MTIRTGIMMAVARKFSLLLLLLNLWRKYRNLHYSQTKWSVPLKIALMNLLFEIWTR